MEKDVLEQIRNATGPILLKMALKEPRHAKTCQIRFLILTFNKPYSEIPDKMCWNSCDNSGPHCQACTNTSYFTWSSTSMCIHPSLKCDGHPQCPNGDDETCRTNYEKNKMISKFSTYYWCNTCWCRYHKRWASCGICCCCSHCTGCSQKKDLWLVCDRGLKDPFFVNTL